MSFRHARNPARHRATHNVRTAAWVLLSAGLTAAFALMAGDVAGPDASAAQLDGMSAHATVLPGHHQARDARAGRTAVSRSAPRTTLNAAVAKRDAAQTAQLAKRTMRNQPGYCLNWARTRAHIPPVYPDAATAWRHASDKRRSWNPPPGAAVYWTGGSHGYGHIAISLGHGLVRSSDAGGEGRVATVRVGWPVRNWGLHYAGWSDTINGYKIPGVITSHHRHRTHHRASRPTSRHGHPSGNQGTHRAVRHAVQHASRRTQHQGNNPGGQSQSSLPTLTTHPSPTLANGLR